MRGEDESYAEKVAVIIKNHYEEVEDEDEAHTEVKMPKTIPAPASALLNHRKLCPTS